MSVKFRTTGVTELDGGVPTTCSPPSPSSQYYDRHHHHHHRDFYSDHLHHYPYHNHSPPPHSPYHYHYHKSSLHHLQHNYADHQNTQILRHRLSREAAQQISEICTSLLCKLATDDEEARDLDETPQPRQQTFKKPRDHRSFPSSPSPKSADKENPSRHRAHFCPDPGNVQVQEPKPAFERRRERFDACQHQGVLCDRIRDPSLEVDNSRVRPVSQYLDDGDFTQNRWISEVVRRGLPVPAGRYPLPAPTDADGELLQDDKSTKMAVKIRNKTTSLLPQAELLPPSRSEPDQLRNEFGNCSVHGYREDYCCGGRSGSSSPRCAKLTQTCDRPNKATITQQSTGPHQACESSKEHSQIEINKTQRQWAVC